MPNRLAGSSSPYLRQHQDNPVDWFPWSPEAFSLAKQLDKPIFLSVGYSSCHWCHVMAHESFEDSEVARVLDEGFVAIKVDREELPDVDEAYMAAVHLTNGRGGWPMSVFLTPDLKPFFAGTYFPKDQFISILRQVDSAWQTKRNDVNQVAEEYANAIAQLFARNAPDSSQGLSADMLAEACGVVFGSADLVNGGFGTQPKFPPHTAISLFLDVYQSPLAIDQDTRNSALALALHALQSMGEGGIHDHVGGGFHRYSVDERWFLPHFEKMLYDNALMLSNYVRGGSAALALDPRSGIDFRSMAKRIVRWMERELKQENGLYGSALDADTHEGEGWYYTWTEAEVDAVLGSKSGSFKPVFGILPEGNCRDEATGKPTGRNIVYAKTEEAQKDWNACLDALLRKRVERNPPMQDSKCIVGWNGLAVKGLAEAQFLQIAERVAGALLDAEARLGYLPHIVGSEDRAYLDDYAYLADGLFALASASGSDRWLDEAKRLTSAMVERFWDSSAKLFRSTSTGHQDLFGRVAPVFDQPAPSGNAIAIRCLVLACSLDKAGEALSGLAGWMESSPNMCEALVHAALLYLERVGSSLEVYVDGSYLVCELALPADWDIVHAGMEGAEIVRVYLGLDEISVESVERAEAFWRIRCLLDSVLVEDVDVRVRYQACTATECLPVEERSARLRA